MSVAVLFARADSVYKQFPGCDVYDAARDARTWTADRPVFAHPPCRAWGRLRKFANPRPDEKALAIFAVDAVRRFGGVLEHPRGSLLWPEMNLPAPGAGRDAFGGWTLGIVQSDFGHRAEKPTLLYIVGVSPGDLPALPPLSLEYAPRVINTRQKPGSQGYRKEVSKAEREHTPAPLAAWLVAVAELARANKGAGHA